MVNGLEVFFFQLNQNLFFLESSFKSFQRSKDQHSVLRILQIVFHSKVYKERRAGLHTFQVFHIGLQLVL